MELSGCDAVMVRADADLDLVIKALKFGLTLNNGATCMAPKRVFVHRAIATELEGRLARAFQWRKHRSRTETSYRDFVTPTSEMALRIIDRLLQKRWLRGAHFHCGRNFSMTATSASGDPRGRRTQHAFGSEDVFAPVLALITVANDARSRRCARMIAPSRSARAFSRARRIAPALSLRSLNAGVVTINDLIVPTADARLPFGGRQAQRLRRDPRARRDCSN